MIFRCSHGFRILCPFRSEVRQGEGRPYRRRDFQTWGETAHRHRKKQCEDRSAGKGRRSVGGSRDGIPCLRQGIEESFDDHRRRRGRNGQVVRMRLHIGTRRRKSDGCLQRHRTDGLQSGGGHTRDHDGRFRRETPYCTSHSRRTHHLRYGKRMQRYGHIVRPGHQG